MGSPPAPQSLPTLRQKNQITQFNSKKPRILRGFLIKQVPPFPIFAP